MNEPILANDSVALETASATETQKLAAIFFDTIHEDRKRESACVVSLEGDLGAGKTTFMQGFAKAAGLKEKVQSPTFVIMKFYRLSKQKKTQLLIHIDAYRIGEKDLLLLGWSELLKNKNAIICVEWGNRIKSILPPDTLRVRFQHRQKDQRSITFSYAPRKK